MTTPPPYVSPTSDDLGMYMNDSDIWADRAQYLIGQAETLCLTVVNPLPVAAVVVVVRMAARAYVGITSSRMVKDATTNFGQVPAGGGVFLTAADRADLRRFQGAGGGFSINLLDGYCPPELPPWDGDGDGFSINVPGS